MALTLTPLDNQDVFGRYKARLATATFDTSYPTGGLDVAAPAKSSLGLLNVQGVVACDNCASTGHVVRYDRPTKKLQAFYGDNNNAADGPLIEVPNATNIATAAITVLVYGD